MYSTKNPEVDKESTQIFFKTQSSQIDPQTGRPISYEKLGEKLGFSSAVTTARRMRALGIYRQPMPIVRHGELPRNEKAFFLGLAQGDFKVNGAHWGNTGFIVFGTESDKVPRRQLLIRTIGTWGEIRERKSEIGIYLAEDIFGFMKNPIVDDSLLKARSRFAPFLLGTVTARLSEKCKRLSLGDEELLRKIHQTFEKYFGFSMGNFEVESRLVGHNQAKEKRTALPVITIYNPKEVLLALKQERSVKSLPFFSSLSDLSLKSEKVPDSPFECSYMINGWNSLLQSIPRQTNP